MDSKFIDEITKDAVDELKRAHEKFAQFNSAHEGWAVLYEEVDELWDAVKMRDGIERDSQLYAEATQVAAMALRFMLFLKEKAKLSEEKSEDKLDPLDKYRVMCEKCNIKALPNHKHCPKCDSPPQDHELRNYSMMWHDGDVHCTKCGEYVRMWDAG